MKPSLFALTALWPAALAAQPIPPGALPIDPANITSIDTDKLVWRTESLGQLQAPLYGDPAKPGPYAVMIRWVPGHFSHPHTHSTDRHAYVVKGTWWVSTGTHYDPATTFPVRQGTFATDLANKVHWDGAKDEEVILLVMGTGPMTTALVPER